MNIDEYRVSLFVSCLRLTFRRWPPWERMLKLYVRSGSLNPQSKAKWSITRSEKEEYDGIVGRAWVTRDLVYDDHLPDITRQNVTSGQLKDYLSRTYMNQDRLHDLNWWFRSFRALAIPGSNEPIGVLIMESRKPGGLKGITSRTLKEELGYFQALFVE